MVLRSIEQKIEALFEGVFGRAFRTHVQPVELARKLAKEMDDHTDDLRLADLRPERVHDLPRARTTASSSRATRPSLADELATYLAEHARREGYALLTAPRVLLRERRRPRDRRVRDRDPDGAAGAPPRPAADEPPSRRPTPGQTMIYRPEPRRRRRRRRPRSSASTRSRPRSSGTATAATARQAARPDRPLARVRHPARRRERLAAARGDPAGGRDLLGRRPRLDERHRGERPAAEAREARGRRPARDRLDRADLPEGRVSRRLDLGRGAPARPEDRLPRAALPLHLADRPQREQGHRRAERELRPRARPGRGAGARAGAARRARPEADGSSSSRSPTLPEGRGAPAERRAARASDARSANDVELRGDDFASRAPRALRAARRTASGSRTSARRTARSSTASASSAHASSPPGDVVRVGETDLRYEL